MRVRSGREWVTLVWVAIVAAVMVTVVTVFAVLIHLPSRLPDRGPSPFWVGFILLLAMGVGVLVGAAAGIERWWLVLPAVCAVLGAFAALAFAAAQALGFLAILLVATGLAAGALFGVVLVDLLAHRSLDGHARGSATGRPSAHGRR